jgi:predicted TIM-barrel fold metal-dependent hydrolase
MVLPHMGVNSMVAYTDWLFTGVLDRHRAIRVAFSEGGAGWVPYQLEQAEKTFANANFRDQFGATRPPREVFAEQMTVCFMCDDAAMAALDVIGEDNMTWESDYPHEDGFFPQSRVRLETTMADVPEPVARKIAETNGRRLFGI